MRDAAASVKYVPQHDASSVSHTFLFRRSKQHTDSQPLQDKKVTSKVHAERVRELLTFLYTQRTSSACRSQWWDLIHSLSAQITGKPRVGPAHSAAVS